MQLLFVTGEFPPMRGGVGDYTARLAETIAAQGHEVGVITSVQARGAASEGVEVMPRVRGWGFGSWREIVAVAQGYDLIHLQYQAGAFEMRPATQLLPDVLRLLAGKPIVTTFHDLRVPYLFPKAGRLREWSVRHLARASDGVVATNAEDEATLRGWGIRRLWQIPIGSNIPASLPDSWDRDAWRAAWQVEPHHKLIVHFGFINRSKDVGALLRAHDGLLRAGQPVRLLMLGDPLGASDPSNTAYLDEIRQRAAEMKLDAPWLQWSGPLAGDEIAKGLLAADLVVLPYRDGASLRRGTLLAPLALGRPVVTTEPATPIPFLEDGSNIAFARRDDPADLARRIALLLRYEPTLQRLERGASTLARHFDWTQIAAQHLAAYRDLLH